jgi:biotin carboxyl carrier protein
VEVMKLFNAIKVDISGRVAHILPENGAMLEYAQF